MWKSIVIAAALLPSGLAAAETLSFASDTDQRCDFKINHTVRLGPTFIDARADGIRATQLFRYDVPRKLTVDGKDLPLDADQQRHMARYYGQLHEASRNLSLLSLVAVDMALQGVSLALTTLAGEDHPDTAELRQTMADVEQRARERFSEQEGVYTLGTSGIEDFMEQTIGEDLEPRIEALALKSSGAIAWHALKAVFTGGRSIEKEAEAAAEIAGEEIERKAEVIEEMADTLCQQLDAIDRTEQALHATIPELSAYDIVSRK